MDFRFQIASDVIGDGLGIELIDANGQVEELVLRAQKTLGSYKDGTPLPPPLTHKCA